MPKQLNLKQPNVGKILTVAALYEEVQEVMFNAKFQWQNRYDTATEYRLKLSNKVQVHCGDESMIVNRNLLDDNPCFDFKEASSSGIPALAQNPNLAHAYTNVKTSHFDSVMFYIKLRWLLKLHSGLCELDNNYCSCRNIIQGMHTLGVQECERVPCDSSFETRRRKQNYQPRQVVDDIIETIERSFGKGYDSFMNYVRTCDPKKCLNMNKTDIHLARVVHNDRLELMMEEIFLMDYIDFPAKTHKVAEILGDIEAFQLPVPRIGPMKDDYIRDYMSSTSSGAREAREKGAQFQSIQFVLNLDIEELGNFRTDAEIEYALEQMSQTFKFRKTPLPLQLYEAAFVVIGHKLIFREGLRNRVLELVKTKYELDDFLLARLMDLTHINLDARLLNEEQIHKIIVNEKEKLCKFFEVYHKSTLPFLQPSIVGIPADEGKDPRYWYPVPTDGRVPEMMQYQPTAADRHFIHVKQPMSGKPEFVVPMGTGPIVRDDDTGRLKTTGYFLRMDGTVI